MSASSQAESSREMYNKRAAAYDDSWHPTFAKTLLSFAQPKQGEEILDLACGTGLVALAAGEAVAPTGHVLGLDISDGMLAVAAAKREELALDVRGLITLRAHDIVDVPGDLAELRGREGSFDVVTCASALVLLTEPEVAVGRWTRLLKPGGRLVVDVPHFKNQRAGMILEETARRMGIEVPFFRSWVVAEDSLPSLLERASGKALKVERVEFVEQAGYGRRWLDSAKEEALAQLKYIMAALGQEFQRQLGHSLADMEQSFIAAWSQAGGSDGKIEEVDGVYVAVAVKQ